MSKKDLETVIHLRRFSLCVLSNDEIDTIRTIKTSRPKMGTQYAVFTYAPNSSVCVQLTKWYKYKGAALNKMHRMLPAMM